MLIGSGRGSGTISCCYTVSARARVAQPDGVVIFSFLSLLFQLFFMLCGLCSRLSASSTHQTLVLDLSRSHLSIIRHGQPGRAYWVEQRRDKRDAVKLPAACLARFLPPSCWAGISPAFADWACQIHVNSLPLNSEFLLILSPGSRPSKTASQASARSHWVIRRMSRRCC